jgi:hypothetical protein
MHACLLHAYVRALLYSFIYHGDRSWPCACASLFKQRPIAVMLTSSIRQCYSFLLQVSRLVSVHWHIASYSYVSSRLAFLAVNMELSGTTRQVPSFGI